MVALEFALMVPILLALLVGIVSYALYFTAVLGVRHAAAEGARAAVAGLGTAERSTLAQARALSVIQGYAPLLSTASGALAITAAPDVTGVFRVRVTYNIGGSPFMRFGAIVPMPSGTIDASVLVSNGSY